MSSTLEILFLGLPGCNAYNGVGRKGDRATFHYIMSIILFIHLADGATYLEEGQMAIQL